LDLDSQIKQSTFVRFPYKGGDFDGAVCYDTLNYVGDKEYFIKEMSRITDGPLLFYEWTIDAYPLEYLNGVDDVIIHYISVDGKLKSVGQIVMDFLQRPDFKRMFYRPGGMISKFNLLVPEDIKTEVGVLCQKMD
jgi:hypothetical protein